MGITPECEIRVGTPPINSLKPQQKDEARDLFAPQSTCPAVVAGLEILKARQLTLEEKLSMIQTIRTITDELAADERADRLAELEDQLARVTGKPKGK